MSIGRLCLIGIYFLLATAKRISGNLFHTNDISLHSTPTPVLDYKGNPYVTVEFLNATELRGRPTALWLNFDAQFLAIGNLDGSVIEMSQTITRVLVPPDFTEEEDEEEHVIFGIASDGEGNIFYSQYHHCLIYKVNSIGEISILAGHLTAQGNYYCGYTMDGHAANDSAISYPGGLQYDANTGDVYFSDAGGLLIRKFSFTRPSHTELETIVGSYNAGPGFSGDGGFAKDAVLSGARFFWLTPAADVLYAADTLNQRIRVVDLTTGLITSLPQLYDLPYSITGDQRSQLYTSSAGNRFYIDKTDLLSNSVSVFAGTGKRPVLSPPTVYGNWSILVPVSNASVLCFDESIGLAVAQEDLANILLVFATGNSNNINTSTSIPTAMPSFMPSIMPTVMPSVTPTAMPTATPSVMPTIMPSVTPTSAPTAHPSVTPSFSPTMTVTTPTQRPSVTPTVSPSVTPAPSSRSPTLRPSVRPSQTPTRAPTAQVKPVVSFNTILSVNLAQNSNSSNNNNNSNSNTTTSGFFVNQTLIFTATEQLAIVTATATAMKLSASYVRFVRARVTAVTNSGSSNAIRHRLLTVDTDTDSDTNTDTHSDTSGNNNNIYTNTISTVRTATTKTSTNGIVTTNANYMDTSSALSTASANAVVVTAEITTAVSIPLIDLPDFNGNSSQLLSSLTQALSQSVTSGNFSEALTQTALNLGLTASLSVLLLADVSAASVGDVVVAAPDNNDNDGDSSRRPKDWVWHAFVRGIYGDGSVFRILLLTVVIVALVCGVATALFVWQMEQRGAGETAANEPQDLSEHNQNDDTNGNHFHEKSYDGMMDDASGGVGYNDRQVVVLQIEDEEYGGGAIGSDTAATNNAYANNTDSNFSNTTDNGNKYGQDDAGLNFGDLYLPSAEPTHF